MKQLVQNLKNGATSLIDAPAPNVIDGCLLINTNLSLISPGTEKMLIDFGKANFLNKAMQQPQKVRQILEKAKNDGIYATYEAVNSKLSEPITLGYCNVGEVVGIGRGVTGFKLGDRVISNGSHAEVVCVPSNLCSRIPKNVTNM